MTKLACVLVLLVLATCCVWMASENRATAAARPAGPMIAHNVYFALKDKSPAAQQKLVAACDKYLADHPGVVFYAAGIMAQELDRPVNVRDFQVGLHVIFADRAAHDRYQTAPQHLKFIEENKETWESVRVFDTVCKARSAH